MLVPQGHQASRKGTEDEMHPDMISQIAAQRTAELYQRADNERVLSELRAARAGLDGRRGSWLPRPAFRHAGRATA
jgi:hypothetical protein